MPNSIYDIARVAEIGGVLELEYAPEAPSTNDWALELAADAHRRLPLLVLCERQTAGRGRGSNRWWFAPGGITFSLVIDAVALAVPQARWPQLALVAGLAICETLQSKRPSDVVSLKWPNDVYLNGRKLCGILVEVPSQVRGRIVVGVGLNVNNSFRDAPAELQHKATSLLDTAGHTFDRTDILVRVVEQMLHQFGRFAPAERDFMAACRRYCYLTGRAVRVDQGANLITGQCHGIADDGSLLVQTATGPRNIVSGTVLIED